MKKIVKYAKNTAIGAGGVGGVAVIVDKLLSSDNGNKSQCKSEERNENSSNLANLTTTTTTILINPIGV